MPDINHIQHTFESLGGRFIISPEELTEKLKKVKVLLFDWDGVFHDGNKDHQGVSNYSETDSMGVNMLRFGIWMQQKKQLPFTAVISGEHNPTANHWATRDNLDALLMGFNHKEKAWEFLQNEYGFKEEEILFVYDDILDLSLVKHTGTRILVRRKANPYFIDYCIENELVHYLTGCESGNHPVREISEVCLQLLGKFEATLENRMTYSEMYKEYNNQRKAIKIKKVRHDRRDGSISVDTGNPIGFGSK